MWKVCTLSSQCTWGPPGAGAGAGAGSVGPGVWVRTPGVVVGRPDGLRRAGGRAGALAGKGAAAAEAEGRDRGVAGPGGLVPMAVRGCRLVGRAGRVGVVGFAGEGERPGGGRTGLLMLMGLLPVAAEEYELQLLLPLGDAQGGDMAAPGPVGAGAGVSMAAPGPPPRDGSASSASASAGAALAPLAVTTAGEDPDPQGPLLLGSRGRGRKEPEGGTQAGWGVPDEWEGGWKGCGRGAARGLPSTGLPVPWLSCCCPRVGEDTGDGSEPLLPLPAWLALPGRRRRGGALLEGNGPEDGGDEEVTETSVGSAEPEAPGAPWGVPARKLPAGRFGGCGRVGLLPCCRDCVCVVVPGRWRPGPSGGLPAATGGKVDVGGPCGGAAVAWGSGSRALRELRLSTRGSDGQAGGGRGVTRLTQLLPAKLL